MPRQIRLGILVPSSNTSLEPLTQAIVASIPNVSVHFSRFQVLKITLDKDGLGQFEHDKIVAAAQLLADAGVDMIGWSGTSASWLGFDADEKLCAAITASTGIPATTSIIALNKAIQLFGVTEIGLVSPYTDDVQEAIVKTYAGIGLDLHKEKHLSMSTNRDFGSINESTLDNMVDEVVALKVQAVTTLCTNLRAAHRVLHWEQRHGLPVFDTVSTVIWDMLHTLEIDTTPLKSWGIMFTK